MNFADVAQGEYTTGAIELKDNVDLHLEAGATIYVSQNKNDYASTDVSLIDRDISTSTESRIERLESMARGVRP